MLAAGRSQRLHRQAGPRLHAEDQRGRDDPPRKPDHTPAVASQRKPGSGVDRPRWHRHRQEPSGQRQHGDVAGPAGGRHGEPGMRPLGTVVGSVVYDGLPSMDPDGVRGLDQLLRSEHTGRDSQRQAVRAAVQIEKYGSSVESNFSTPRSRCCPVRPLAGASWRRLQLGRPSPRSSRWKHRLPVAPSSTT